MTASAGSAEGDSPKRQTPRLGPVRARVAALTNAHRLVPSRRLEYSLYDGARRRCPSLRLVRGRNCSHACPEHAAPWRNRFPNAKRGVNCVRRGRGDCSPPLSRTLHAT
ncbi:hypothetical protein MRX96_013518 [Rhipicephalus microplus]